MILERIDEDYEDFCSLFLAKKCWIQIRIHIGMKSGIRIHIKTLWIRHTAGNNLAQLCV